MSDVVAPSKGAIEAARRIFQDVGEVHALDIPRVGQIIDRETKSPQMAALLNELMMLETPTTRNEIARFVVLRSKAERLLSELEVKP